LLACFFVKRDESDGAAAAHNQGDDKENQEEHKQNPGNIARRAGDSAKAKNGGN